MHGSSSTAALGRGSRTPDGDTPWRGDLLIDVVKPPLKATLGATLGATLAKATTGSGGGLFPGAKFKVVCARIWRYGTFIHVSSVV